MRMQGTLAGIVLLLLLSTTRSATLNGRIKSKREVTSTTQTIPLNDNVKKETPKILVPYNSGKINEDLLSLADSQNAASKEVDVRTSVDQQVDQSQTVLIKDIENMEDALSILEYEPQKINRKDKRKISVPYKNPEQFNSENKEPVPTVISNTYYDPVITKPKKLPRYYSNPSQEGPIPSDSESGSKSRDTEYPYPVSAHRSHKSRSSKNRPSLSSPEERKLENPPTTSIDLPPKVYSSSSSELKKQRHHAEPTVTSTPSSNPQSTKLIRKKKIRKRPRAKVTNNENSNNKSKSRRLGSSINSAKVNQESNLEKLNVEGVASSPDRRSINQSNVANNKDADQLSKVIDPIRRSSSSVEEHNVSSYGGYYNSPLEDQIVYKDRPKLDREDLTVTPSSLEAYGNDRGSSTYQNVKTSVTPSLSFQDYENDESPVTPSLRSHGILKGSSAYQSTKTSVAPSSFEDYENSNTPANLRISKNVPLSTLESYQVIDENSEVPTVTPSIPIFHTVKAPTVTVYSVGPSGSTDRSYVSSASTLPAQRFEVSTWTPKTKYKRLRESQVDEEDERRSSDIIAEATNLGNEEPEESKENRRSYEDDTSTEHKGDDYHQNIRQMYRNKGNHGHHNGRYAQKYDENNDDVQAEGTHGEGKYEGSKEGTGGDGKGKEGGKGEFEEGEGGKHEEGHHELEDEKGEKGYKSWDEEEKANKGHHDKEQHSNYYEEDDAKKKEHKEDGEYHEEHQQGEKGEKAAEFDEKGQHQKGYNTKGEHSVHKKDEFEKRTEFFDEFNEGDDIEKEGEFHREHESSKGGHEKVGHLDKADHEEHYGKEGKHENGKHYNEEEGHKVKEGKEAHYEHEDMHGGKKGQEEEKKWAYKKGDDGDGGKGDGKSGGKGHESDH